MVAKFTVLCLQQQSHGSSSKGVHPVRWSGGVVLFLRIMGPSDDPVLLGLDIVKEGRPLPQDEVRMFLAKPQFSLDHELVVETLLPNILVPTK